MTNEKDESGNLLPDEVRLTKFGKWLRNTSLDEMPEAINIFLGQMSVIGPRPLLVEDYVFFNSEVMKRQNVKPGLSGLAQISGRNNISWEDKFKHDLQYIKKVTFWKDLLLIFKTIGKAFIKKENIDREGFATDEDYGKYLLRTKKINEKSFKDKMFYATILKRNNKPKIGIITHYYNSQNYGGVLQSFALCNYLNSIGLSSEQICYDSCSENSRLGTLMLKFKTFVSSLLKKSKKSISSASSVEFKTFRNSIPHTHFVYSAVTIKKNSPEYEYLITGSDQVWNPQAICDAYLLSFGKGKKLSYAASLACNELPSNTVSYYKKNLSKFSAISVREKSGQKLLEELGIDSTVCVDPVLLLSPNEWLSNIETKNSFGDYIFCYFLGNNQFAKRSVEIISKKMGLKTLSIFNDDYAKHGSFVKTCGPLDFVNLIYNAKCVLTDSFHAVVFSSMFSKHFLCFERSSTSKMNSRVVDYLSLLGGEELFAKNENYQLVDSFDTSKTDYSFSNIEKYVANSKAFLMENLR